MKRHKTRDAARFHVEFGEDGMPDLSDAPDDTAIPVKFRMEREVVLLDGAPDPNQWDDKQQGMFLYLLILHEYQQKLPDPDQPLTKAMVEAAVAEARTVDELVDGGPLELMLQRAKGLAATFQYERAGALWRRYETEAAKVRERERLAELGKKLTDHLEESRAEASRTHRTAAEERYKEWKRISLAIRKAHPSWSNTQVAQATAKRIGRPQSWHAIRKMLPEFGAQRRKPSAATTEES